MRRKMYLAMPANRKYENKTENLISIWIATKKRVDFS